MYPRSICGRLSEIKRDMRKASNSARKSHRNALQEDFRLAVKPDGIKKDFKVSRFEGINNTLQCYFANGVTLPFSISPDLKERIHAEAVHEMDTKVYLLLSISVNLYANFPSVCPDVFMFMTSVVRIT